jgi:hypothetical protein
MQAYEVAPDLWVWTGRHEEIGHDVVSVYLKAGSEILLIDPILPPEDPEGFWRALDRDVLPIEGVEVHVLLTAPSHTRNSREMLDRYPGSRLWAQRSALEAVESHGVAVTDRFEPGDPLPGGLGAYPSGKPNEVVFWIPEHRTLVIGNVVFHPSEGGIALPPAAWLPEGTAHEQLRAALAPLLALGPERLLVGHGDPVLEHAGEALRQLVEH